MPSIKVNGMHCPHCKATVEKTAATIDGVSQPVVDLEKHELAWEESAPVNVQALKDAIRAAGFDPE